MSRLLRYHARLLPDGGRAALSAHFFRSEPYLRAEGVTHTLSISSDDGVASVPLVVRKILESDRCDAMSPYGYPGAELKRVAQIPVDQVDWSETEVVSIFVRDCINRPSCFAGGNLRLRPQIIDPTKQLTIRKMHRRQIRRNLDKGFFTVVYQGGDAPTAARDSFRALYRETLVRGQAVARYFCPDAWFDVILEYPGTYLLITYSPVGDAAAGVIAVVSDGLLHYYLGGTADGHVPASPFKNTVQTGIELASALGIPLNIGAGLREGDSLEHFKRGFANDERAFYTHEIVCDRAAYAELSANKEPSSFFPLYRSTDPENLSPPQRWCRHLKTGQR